MTTQSFVVLIGAICGVLAAIPTSLLILLILNREKPKGIGQ